MKLFWVYDGTRTRKIPDHNRARCLRASYTVGIGGFEPPCLLLPKQAPYQTWLYPVVKTGASIRAGLEPATYRTWANSLPIEITGRSSQRHVRGLNPLPFARQANALPMS